MYKWVRPNSVYRNFDHQSTATYKFPPGWGRIEGTFKDHLINANCEPFSGKTAWLAAQEWQQLEAAERQSKQDQEQRQNEYRAFHFARNIIRRDLPAIQASH